MKSAMHQTCFISMRLGHSGHWIPTNDSTQSLNRKQNLYEVLFKSSIIVGDLFSVTDISLFMLWKRGTLCRAFVLTSSIAPT